MQLNDRQALNLLRTRINATLAALGTELGFMPRDKPESVAARLSAKIGTKRPTAPISNWSDL